MTKNEVGNLRRMVKLAECRMYGIEPPEWLKEWDEARQKRVDAPEGEESKDDQES